MKVACFLKVYRAIFGIVILSFAISTAKGDEYATAKEAMKKRSWVEAVNILKRLHDQTPSSASIAYDYALSLLRVGRRPEAVSLLSKYGFKSQAKIAQHSFLSEEGLKIYQSGLSLIEQKNIRAGCERFERALTKDPGHWEITLRYGQCEILDGRSEEGLSILNELKKSTTFDPDLELWRARAFSQLAQWDAAIPIYQDLLQRTPTWETALFSYSEASIQNKQPSIALVLLDPLLKKSPEHRVARLLWLKARWQTLETPASLADFDLWTKKMAVVVTKPQEKRPAPDSEFSLSIYDEIWVEKQWKLIQDDVRSGQPPRMKQGDATLQKPSG